MMSCVPACLLPVTSLDLETTLNGEIRHIGACTDQGKTFEQKSSSEKANHAALAKLDDFCQESTFLLGHNLIGHDIPVLAAVVPDLALLQKPIIDTLFLSPLAFPRNPYHRLVKDYKLVKDAINDPVADARLALSIFEEQYQSFKELADQEPDLIRFYHFCFSTAQSSERSDSEGLAAVFESLIDQPFKTGPQVLKALIMLCQGLACPKQINRIAIQHFPKAQLRMLLPYCVAWLKVSGGNSVIPPWVRHRFPEIPNLLKQLRDEHCGNDNCSYCSENHDPVKQLQRYFNYPDFRNSPDGRPLQKDIVLEGMNDKSLLGILPTGGGKSICFQIPALVRYHRRGLLTVIISPLQALMKDQVDNLKSKTGSMAVGAIYGMLTPPERGAMLEQVRMGDIGLLYISPEQLRNKSVINALSQREIGCWVFDEAHCLSKWGHDFRPDYLYCGRFVREQASQNKLPVPPVACYTATAKTDVIEDINQHFKTRLNQELTLFQGGVERTNLSYEVHSITSAAKYGQISELIKERLPDDGSCVIYCATRKNTEELSQFLLKQHSSVSHFHGGLDAPTKTETLEQFVSGDIRIICATNAFGMGVDKDNVRLVIHADIPGSLENYLQEAGRAGRDEQPAECILLFNDHDLETQFKLGALSEVRQNDIQQILRGVRRLEKKPGQDIVITTGELLRSDQVDTSFGLDDKSADTKVKTAIAWLERSGFIERNENSNQVFQGKPLFSTLEEAKGKLDQLQLNDVSRKRWEWVLLELINANPDEGISADILAENIGRQTKSHQEKQQENPSLSTTDVMAILNQMADVGLVSHGLLMTAFIRPKGRNNARDSYKKLCELELAMVQLLQEEHPDDHEQQAYPLDLRVLNQKTVDAGIEFSNPDILKSLLKSLAEDGKGLAGSRGSVDFRYIYKDHFSLKLCRSWANILLIIHKRHALSQRILDALYQAIHDSEQPSTRQVLIEFSLEKLRESIRQDMTLEVSQDKELAAIERGLLFLHEQQVIVLQHGLAVFRSAMTLKVNEESKSRRYNKGDYSPLLRHYKAKVTQVHVMNEYVRLGLDKMSSALRLVNDYFSDSNAEFLKKYFRNKKKLLDLATSEQSLNDIVESLGNPQQQSIVQAPVDQNMLVLAGPGSGKTRVVVHRCAYLMRVERVRPFSILVLCYNHSAASTLRKRLQALLGHESREVTVQTFHGLAMRLTGTSFNQEKKKTGPQDLDFADLIPKATALLRGEALLPGMAGDAARERLLAGFQHVLVDEYQDIDEQQYDMISAIAGRTLNDGEQKLSVLAVGDDDQSIYGFRDANVKFIRQFEQDYQAERHYLVQNYRSTGHIIAGANSLIHHNQDRMKTDQDIKINDARKMELPGGRFDRLDAVGQGKIQILQSKNLVSQTLSVVQELKRLSETLPDLEWHQCAVLARFGLKKPELSHLRAAFEQAEIPIALPLESGKNLPLFRIREFDQLLSFLKPKREEMASASHLLDWVEQLSLADSLWKQKILELIDTWTAESGDSELPVSAFATYVVDYLREARREQRLGEGVHLGTAHSCKGLEFRVVIILDGNWQESASVHYQYDSEEERRLYYVAMTRAMEQLVLCQRQDEQNPHISLLSSEACVERVASPTGSYPVKTYQMLGLRDVYLSYAGTFSEDHKIHTALQQLSVGSALELREQNQRIVLFDPIHKIPVALLSKPESKNWLHVDLAQVSVTIIAMVKWRKTDSDEEYQDRHKCDGWEVPVVELTSVRQ